MGEKTLKTTDYTKKNIIRFSYPIERDIVFKVQATTNNSETTQKRVTSVASTKQPMVSKETAETHWLYIAFLVVVVALTVFFFLVMPAYFMCKKMAESNESRNIDCSKLSIDDDYERDNSPRTNAENA